MSEPTIPDGVAEVTPTWMTDVLRASGAIGADARVTSLATEQIGQGVGLMGELYVAGLGYDGSSGPSSVVVKLPASAAESREQGIALGMYEAECRFYAEMAAATATGLPEIHLSTIVPGTGDFVVVMEDLSHLELVSQSEGMTVEQAGAAVRVLADIHAAWWGKVDDDAVAWVPPMNGERIAGIGQILPGLWPVFEGAFGDALPDGGRELGAEWSSRYFELMSGFAERSPWTLVHQDYRVENILFGDPAADEVVVIDWQGLGRGPGGYDVAYVLGGSLDTELRREHEAALVDEYHGRLRDGGVEIDRQQVWDDYRYAMLLGGLATTVFAAATLDLSNERGRSLIASMADRHFTAALDHGGFSLVD